MNIALITPSFLPMVGGLEWKVHYLATEYRKMGHNVIVFANRIRGHVRDQKINANVNYDIVRCSYPVCGIGLLGIERRLFGKAIRKHHKKRPFDVVHCHHLATATQCGVDLKKKTGVPLVATTTGGDVQIAPQINYGARLKPRFDRIVRSNLKLIDVVGSISKNVHAELEAMGTTARIVDIPNGVNWKRFQTGKSLFLREKLNLDKNTLIILSVGRNHVIKGYRFAIKAFASVADTFKDVCYVIVGRGTERLIPLIEELGMQRRIRLVEEMPMSKMPQIYHSADVFFNPSTMEGFAQVNAQALACALPCVITDAPGNVDAGDDGGALIARSENVVSMAEKLTLLIGDTELRQELAKQAHLASRKYAWSNIAQQYLSIFEGLLLDRTSS